MRLAPFACLVQALLLLCAATLTAQSPQPQTLQSLTLALESGPAPHTALAARRDLLLPLLRTDPAAARAAALPLATRNAILAADPTAAPFLESDLTLTGELVQSIADNWTDTTHQDRYTLHTPTADLDLTLSPTLLATAPANHHQVTVRGLALANVLAADSLTDANPADCAAPLSSRAANTAASSAPALCSPLGVQRIAVLLLKFPNNTPALPTGIDTAAYWNTVLFGQNPSVNTFWQEVSQAQTSATGDVYGPFQLSTLYDCSTTTAMQAAAIAAASATVDFSQYNRVVLVYPATSCTFGGLGNLGCVGATATIGHQYSVVWFPILPTYRADFTYPQMWGGTAHELGHNLGLNHANTLDFGAISLGPLDFSTTNPGTVNGSGGGTGTGSNLSAVNTEYGDRYDVMGYPWSSGGPYNAVHRAKTLGWIPPAEAPSVTTSGSYSLAPAENPSGLRALHVLRDPSSASWLWVEFHQQTGFYESANYVTYARYNNTETSGAQIHYETPLSSNAYTYLLDMTPQASATAGNNNFYDGTLAPGTTWQDPYSLLSITANTQTASNLGVTIAYDKPCATLTILSASVFPVTGGSGYLSIAAPATCPWTATTNAPWITFTGTTSGSGSGVVPFTVAANNTALQRNTFLTAQRQSVALVQLGGGINLQAFSPGAGTSAAGTNVPFHLIFSDGLGLSDIQQINFDFSGFATPDCQVAVVPYPTGAYLYLYSGNAFTKGLLASTPGTLSSPSCTLSAAGSSYTPTLGGLGGLHLTLDLTFTSSFLGSHNIVANAYGSTSTGNLPLGIWTVTNAVTPVTTTTTIAATPASPSTFGQSVSFLASVTPAAATGTFLFTVDGQPAGTFPVLNGSPTGFVTTQLPVGTHTLYATYSGDTLNAPSTSPTLTYIVNPAPLATTTLTLTASATTLLAGGSTTLTASAASSAANLTGSILFSDGTTPLATVPLTNGTATFAASTLAAGLHPITATLVPGSGFAPASSAPLTIVVQDFAFSIASPNVTLNAGTGQSFPLTLTPGTAGFSSPIALTCTGAPAASTCTVTPATVTPGSQPGTATITLTTTAHPALLPGRFPWPALPLIALLPFIPRRRRAPIALAALLTLAIFTTLSGCGSGGTPPGTLTPGTPAGTYTLTITGTATAATTTLTHTQIITLKII